jgi:ABC-type antimicrobial peptide transport system permease subunit
MLPALQSDPTVEAIAVGATANPMRSDGVSFGVQVTTSVKGTLDPTVTSGRLPRAPDEVLLGTRTAASLRARIGSTVPVSISAFPGDITFRVVGLGVLAPFSALEQLGRGAVLSPDGLRRFLALAPPDSPEPPPSDLLVRFAGGVSKTEAIATLSRRLGGPGQVSVFPSKQPADVASFGQVSRLPGILAGLLAVLAAAATAHLLISSVRRRRRDLAILKSLGLAARETAAVITWEAGAVTVIALVVGLPLGISGGRWLWALVARQVGFVPEAAVHWGVMAALVPAVALTAGVIATGPAIAASRIRPAVALRTE